MFASIARAARLIFQPGYAGIALRSALLTLVLFLVGKVMFKTRPAK
jgi:hypothetical protein